MATVVVTGATGAIGAATVAALKNRRANVIALSRPAVDLSSMVSVRAAARELGRVDVLMHIASVFTTKWQKTPDGFELMLATNYVGPFLLTNLLRDQLSGGRVITVTAPSTTHVDLGRLLERNRGETGVELELYHPHDFRVTIQSSDFVRVRSSPELVRQIESICGQGSVQLIQ